MTLHVRELAGANSHHIIEAAFKAAGRAMRYACELDPRVNGVPSTKGLAVREASVNEPSIVVVDYHKRQSVERRARAHARGGACLRVR